MLLGQGIARFRAQLRTEEHLHEKATKGKWFAAATPPPHPLPGKYWNGCTPSGEEGGVTSPGLLPPRPPPSSSRF